MHQRAARADDAGVRQPDQCDEQTDTDADRHAQVQWHRTEDGLPEAGEHQQGDHGTLDDDQPHGLRPSHDRGDHVGQHRVQAETGGKTDREASDNPHQDRHHAGDQRGDRRHHADRLADGRRVDHRLSGIGELGGARDQIAVAVGGGPDDERVQGQDVGHREEGHQTTAHLTRNRGAALAYLEPSFDGRLLFLGRGDRRPLRGIGDHGRHRRVTAADPYDRFHERAPAIRALGSC